MSGLAIGLIVLFVAGVAIAIYAFAAPRRSRVAASPTPSTLHVDNGWTAQAAGDFDGLSESARCDMLFAVALLDDDRSRSLLQHALSDSSEAVALAAAHALASRDHAADVEQFLAKHPGERADRLAHALALLDPQARGSA